MLIKVYALYVGNGSYREYASKNGLLTRKLEDIMTFEHRFWADNLAFHWNKEIDSIFHRWKVEEIYVQR